MTQGAERGELRADGRPAAWQPEDFGVGRLFWAIREAVVVADADSGRIVLWNPAAEDLLGYPAAEALGLDVAVLVPEHLREAHRAGLGRYRQTGHGRLVDTGAPAELLAVRRDGSEVPIELTLTPLDAAGRRYALALIRDLTERHRAEAEVRAGAESFAALFEAAGEGIVIHEGGRHVAVNRALADMLGYEPGELVGRHSWEVVAPASRETVRRHALAGYERPYEAVGLRKDGSTFPCEILGKPIRYRGCPARLVTIRDISERRRAEEALAAAVRERAAREAAEAAVRTRETFLLIAAHELKTPVTALLGAAQLLLRRQERGALDAGRLTRGLATIERAAGRLAALTGDLLDVSYLRTGELPLDRAPVDLVALAHEVADRTRELHGETHEIEIDAPVDFAPVAADAARLEQVLTNLLDNAVKYSPGGGAITVAVRAEAGGVSLRVRDAGIGLPPGSEGAIFAPLGRAANAARRHLPGMGLGLYICRGIVERHGGRIWAESRGEGAGTTITVWLPCAGG